MAATFWILGSAEKYHIIFCNCILQDISTVGDRDSIITFIFKFSNHFASLQCVFGIECDVTFLLPARRYASKGICCSISVCLSVCHTRAFLSK